MKTRRWTLLFIGLTVLVLAQLGWWTTILLKDVSVVESLRVENMTLRPQPPGPLNTDSLFQDSHHRRVMILSESGFFVVITLAGLYLLYRALRSEERSREIQRNFIEIFSHESKTPLTALKLRLESFLERSSPQDGRELRLCLDEVRRLSHVFERTMDLNRLERRAFQWDNLALSDIVKQVLRRMEPLFQSRSVSITFNLGEEAPIRGDLYGLQNSVQSILENSVIYNTSSAPHVKIEIRRQKPDVFLEISDNGPGISPVDRSRIFERFYRGKDAGKVGGTGLGLYIAKTIVEAHEGRLSFEDRDPRGTHFRISIPEASA